MKPVKTSSINQNYYELLDVNMGADEEDIRRSYEKIKKIYAEGSLATYGLYSDEELKELRELVEKAFRILIDSENRREYDQTLISHPVEKAKRLKVTVVSKPETANKGDSDRESDKTGNEEVEHSEDNAEADHAEDGEGEEAKSGKNGIELPDDVEITGGLLMKLREEAGIDLRKVSERTKVSVTNLRMLESETWDKLPALVYLKGFIVQYCRYLKIDRQRVLDSLVGRYENAKDYSEH